MQVGVLYVTLLFISAVIGSLLFRGTGRLLPGFVK